MIKANSMTTKPTASPVIVQDAMPMDAMLIKLPQIEKVNRKVTSFSSYADYELIIRNSY